MSRGTAVVVTLLAWLFVHSVTTDTEELKARIDILETRVHVLEGDR